MNDHELARHIAQRAGDLLMGIRAASDPSTSDELAALADVATHDLIATLLQEQRPDDAVLSEEGADDKSRLQADRVWIIDPLDGSWHFAMGEPDFAVQVALWQRNLGITAAAVYVPAVNQMLCMDDDVVAQPVTDEIRLLVSITRPPQNLASLCAAISAHCGLPVTTLKHGSVGAKLALMISGQADVYINQGGFHQWDIAAPLGVAQHYGYIVCDAQGNSLELNKPATAVENAIISRPEFVPAVIKSLA